MFRRSSLMACALAAAAMCSPAGASDASTEAAAKSIQAAAEQARWQLVAQQLEQSLALKSAARREAALQAQLLALAQAPPLPQLRASISALTDYESEFLITVDPEHRNPVQAPAYPVDLAARSLLRRWDIAEAAAPVLARWRAGDLSLPAAPAVLEQALADADNSMLEALAETHGELPDAALAQIALRLNQPRHFQRWLLQAEDSTALNALPALAGRLGDGPAFELLMQLRERPGLASSATLAMTELDDSRVVGALIAGLGHPQYGTSSAQALARQPSALWLDQLPAAADGLQLQHSLLALRWNESAESRQQLASWLENGLLPAELRTEVQTWLR